ncbi:MAG: ABC transporter ATP-binding protein/permease [Bdellovibrio sp.]|nr:ABC transporter ATP-binding protein/permease [Bdellovibrio sp.]
MKSLALKYLDKKLCSKLLALSTIQQLVAAFGTFALAEAGLHINSYTEFLIWFLLGLTGHLVSPAFGIFLRPLETQLSYHAYYLYLREKLLSKVGRPAIWQEKHQRETFLASIGSETEMYLAAIIFVFTDLYSYVLSIVLSVLVLGYVLDISFIPAFILAGLLSAMTYKLLSKKATIAFESEQTAKTNLGGHLLTSWENAFFSNYSVVTRFKNSLSTHLKTAEDKSMLSARWNEGMTYTLFFTSSIPVSIALIYTIYSNQGQVAPLVALLATAPRQLNLLMTFRSIFQAMTSLISFETKFKTLSENANLKECRLEERINLEKITINGAQETSLNEIVQTIEDSYPQRLEVRGGNGAGKSTLLLHLNEHLGSSFYLPSQPQFDIPNKVNASTGQTIAHYFDYLETLKENVLLLDEWDANLDEKNIQLINEKLNRLSKTKTILEVRHR